MFSDESKIDLEPKNDHAWLTKEEYDNNIIVNP